MIFSLATILKNNYAKCKVYIALKCQEKFVIGTSKNTLNRHLK